VGRDRRKEQQLIVLSIHDGHDSGACLIRDGRIVLHSSEERRVNRKNAMGVPRESIAAIFERSSIDPSEVDLVALCGTVRTFSRRNLPPIARPAAVAMNTMIGLARSDAATKLGRKVLGKVRRSGKVHEFLAEFGLGDTPVKAYDHHLCHAACAYWHRPWEDDALVLTHDGAGDGLCATVNVGSGHDIRVIDQTPKFHSLANFLYSSITAHLGLKPWEHEYKVMGMAPYGRAEYCIDILRPMWGVEGLKFRNRTGRAFGRLAKLYRNKLAGQRFDNLCAATQQVFEELMLEWVRNAVEATGVRKICAAGGAFLNVKANKLIRELDEVEAFYAYPASDDGGTPVGAAILGYLDVCRQKGVEPELDLPRDMYLGLEFSAEEMERAIKESGHPYRRMQNPADEIANLVAEGQIIARFDGREEVGPRALGNRTILADPRDLGVIRKINFAIKKRDFWMPFAASILDEDAERYIADCTAWPFWMIEAFDTTPEAQVDVVAGLHPMDLTIRPQVVDDLNPGYRDFIRAFKARTGVGAILNTSYNLHGFPIVGTPEVAIHTLDHSELDGLALGPFLVGRKDRPTPGVETAVQETAQA
jgi:carbamoyltransferase